MIWNCYCIVQYIHNLRITSIKISPEYIISLMLEIKIFLYASFSSFIGIVICNYRRICQINFCNITCFICNLQCIHKWFYLNLNIWIRSKGNFCIRVCSRYTYCSKSRCSFYICKFSNKSICRIVKNYNLRQLVMIVYGIWYLNQEMSTVIIKIITININILPDRSCNWRCWCCNWSCSCFQQRILHIKSSYTSIWCVCNWDV